MTTSNVRDAIGVPMGYEKITGLSAAKGLTEPAYARYAIIQAQTQDVRWRDDGTDPTATDGMLLATSNAGFVYTGDIAKIKFIEVSASAVLHVSYYG